MDLEKRLIQSIQVDEINKFDILPDFVTPTNSELPIVVQNGEIYECIENFQAVEKAKEASETEIECLVIIPTEQSEYEVAIRKAASRIKTLGGKAAYSEQIKIIRSLLNYLKENCKDLKIYAHGGCRKGEDFRGNRGDDVRTLIQNRLGLSRNTVSKYLAYGEYLDDGVLDEFAASEKPLIDKEFFEGFQSLKRQKIMDLKGEKKPEEAIQEGISTLARQQFERLKGGKPGADKPKLTGEKNGTESSSESERGSGNAEVNVSNQEDNEAADSDEVNQESKWDYNSLRQELKSSWLEVEKIIDATDENSDQEPLQEPLDKHMEICRKLLTKSRKQKKQQSKAA